MSFNTPVYIRWTSPGTYNPETGNYSESVVSEEKKYVNLQQAETELKTQDLGGVTEEVITITFQQPPKRPFTSIRYGEKIFNVESSLYPRTATTFILKEVK